MKIRKRRRITSSIETRFWKCTVAVPNGCWYWIAAKSGNGYGRIGQRMATHVSLELHGKPRPGKLFALHTCDNPPCVNPNHLYWGTAKDNARDTLTRNLGKKWQDTRPRPISYISLKEI